MSEDILPEADVPPMKQYIMMVDQVGMTFMSRVFQGLKFLEVEGMIVEGNEKHQFLVNPTQRPEEPTPPQVA